MNIFHDLQAIAYNYKTWRNKRSIPGVKFVFFASNKIILGSFHCLLWPPIFQA